MDAIAEFTNTPDSLRLKDAEQLKAQELQIGFIAQDVEKAADEIGFDFHAVDKPKNENDFYGLRYSEFVPVLVKAIQEQQKIIQQQKSDIQDQQNVIEQQQSDIQELKELIQQQNQQIEELRNRVNSLEELEEK
jgi:predicted RNase H-like nuclease (RuvC/YqgF family)